MRKPMQKIRHNSDRSIVSELTTPEDLNRPQPVRVDLRHSRDQSGTLHQKGKLISQSKNPSHRFLAKKFKKILPGNETTAKSSREDELLDELSEIRSQYSEELNELKVKLNQRSNSITTMERTLRLQADTIAYFRTVVDSQKEDITSLTSETEIESDDGKSDGSRERSASASTGFYSKPYLGDQSSQTKRYARRRVEAMPKSKFLPEQSDRRSQSAPRLDSRRDNSPDRPQELQKQSSATSIETTDSSPPEERESVYGSMGRNPANADFPAHPREVARRSRSVPKVRTIHSRRSSFDESSRVNRNGENRYTDPVNQEIFSRSSQRENAHSIHSRTSQRHNASGNEHSLYSSHQRPDISSSNHETSRLGRRPSSEQPRLSRSCHDGYYLNDIGDSMRSERRSSDIREKDDVLDRVRRRNSQNSSTSRRDHDHGKFEERNSRRASLNRTYHGMDDSLDKSGHSANIRRKSLNRTYHNDLNESETSLDMSRRSSLNRKEDFGDATRRESPSRRQNLDNSGQSSNVRIQSLNRSNHRKDDGFDSSQNSLNLPKRRSLDHSGHSSKLSRRASLNSREGDISQGEVSDDNIEIKTTRRPSINRSCHGIDASLDNSGHSSKERRSSLGRSNHEKDGMANTFGNMSEPRLRRPSLGRSAYEKNGIENSSERMSEPRRSSFISAAVPNDNKRSKSASRRRSLDAGPSQGGQIRRSVSEENFGKERRPEKLPDWAIARKSNKSNSQRCLDSNGRQRSVTNRFHLAPVVTPVRERPSNFISNDFEDDLSQMY